ncbi:MAG: hypothetical protein ACRELY_13030 [Polyangiaceae bacterium]
MAIVRGGVTSLIFAIAWIAVVFHSRPALTLDTSDASRLQSSIAALETWSFTPALLHADERAAYETAKTVPEARAGLARADAKIEGRLVFASALVLLGIVLFWGSVRMIAQKKNPATGLGVVIGPPLACLVPQSLAGFLLSGPPLVAGVMIAAITLVSKRSAAPRS